MKTTRFLLMAGFVLGLGVAFVQCGPAKCAAANCSGCCDPGGACLGGTANSSCGKGGATCAACTGGQTCSAQVCTGGTGGGSGGGTAGGTGGGSGGGTAGGTTGGGTGGGTAGGTGGSGWDGGAVVCSSTRTFTVPYGPNDVGSVRYHAYSDAIWNRVRWDADPSIDGGLFVYQQIFFPPGGITVPFNTTFPQGQTWYGTYDVADGGMGSAMALTDCDNATGLCNKRYLSQGGTATYTVIGVGSNGRMVGSAANIHLVAWDYQTETVGTMTTITVDQPLANADCIDVTAWSYDLTYHALSDGGTNWTVNAPADAGCDGGADGGC